MTPGIVRIIGSLQPARRRTSRCRELQESWLAGEHPHGGLSAIGWTAKAVAVLTRSYKIKARSAERYGP